MPDGKICFLDQNRLCEPMCQAYGESKVQPCTILFSLSRLASLATPSRPVAPAPKVKT